MQQGRIAKIIYPVLFPPQFLGYHHGILAHPRRMTLGIGILCIYCIRKCLDSLQRHLFYLFAPLFRDRCLPCHLFIQAVCIFDLTQSHPVVLGHCQSRKYGKARKNDRKPLHEFLIIVHAEPFAIR